MTEPTYRIVKGPKTPASAAAYGGPWEVVFSQLGNVTVDTSGRWYKRGGGTCRQVVASLAVAGSSSTVLELSKNDVTFVTIVFDAGETFKVVNVEVAFEADVDYMRAAVTTAGTDAEKIVAQARF